jgi:single-strand DNA-binding protein
MTNTITIAGRLGEDPALRFTSGGKAVANLRLAHSKRKQVNNEWVDDGPTLWLDVVCWEGRAERIAEQARKGDEVLVTGRLTVREHDGKTYHGIASDAVAVIRSKGAAPSAQTTSTAPAANDPWASAPVQDEPVW